MRVILVSIYDVARSGGLSSHVEEVAAGLISAGHVARVLTPYTAWTAWTRHVTMDLPRVPIRIVDRDAAYCYFLAAARRLLSGSLRGVIARDKVDVIHAHDPIALLASRDALARTKVQPRSSNAAGADAKRQSAIPTVLTVHGDIANMAASDGAVSTDGRGRRWAQRLEALAFRAADAVLPVDDRLRRHCLTLEPKCEPVAVPNFVNVDRFRPAAEGERAGLAALRESLGIGESGRLLLVPRRLVKKTGVLFAVRAMAEPCLTRSKFARVILVVAGDGPERSEIERAARSLQPSGSPARVHVLGDVPRASMIDLYRAADAVIVPSVPHEGVIEATSISALEAMATGKVVIASQIGGLAEVIQDGVTGVLVPPGDAPAIARAVVRVLEDSASTVAIERAARAYVERERSTARCVNVLVDLYRLLGACAA